MLLSSKYSFSKLLCFAYLSHSVNFYFTDESEPSLVFERLMILSFVYTIRPAVVSTLPTKLHISTEVEPMICFIATESCQARNLNSTHTRTGEQFTHKERKSHVVLYTSEYFHHTREPLILRAYLHRQQPYM